MQGENPPRGGGQQPIVGEQPQNQTIIVDADTPWVQQLEIWMMPHGFLRAAAAQERDGRSEDGRRQEIQRGDASSATTRPRSTATSTSRTWSSASRPGSTTRSSATCSFEAIYSDYKDVGGAQFPMHIVQKQGGYPIFDLTSPT